MSKKHVLIVDDSRDILFLLQLSMKQLGPEWTITTAMDGPSALEKIRRQKFDLVLTDYMMPGMTGMELAEEVRRISPDTQVVMMTAYDSARLREQVAERQLQGYVGKPFTVPEILKTVRQIMAQSGPPPVSPGTAEASPPSSPKYIISDHLKTLASKSGALFLILLDIDGRPVAVEGGADPEKISRLAAFVAANFLAARKLASLLDEGPSTFKSSYYESDRFNIYVHTVNSEFLLAVVFGSAGKPGTVWFYTKQAASALSPLLEQASGNASSSYDSTSVANTFESLLGDEGNSVD